MLQLLLLFSPREPCFLLWPGSTGGGRKIKWMCWWSQHESEIFYHRNHSHHHYSHHHLCHSLCEDGNCKNACMIMTNDEAKISQHSHEPKLLATCTSSDECNPICMPVHLQKQDLRRWTEEEGFPVFLFNLHVTPRRCSAHQRALQSVWTEFLFPLSGCRNKLICFQLSCPSSLLQSAHSESCHWARWQQGLISYEHSSDFGSLIGPSGLSDPFSGSVQVEQPQENLSSPFSARVSNTLTYIFTHARVMCE